ncbi:S8 family serine peptidase [Cellulosilyticum ruminicola]|uniref:S8 family serine peptidase n=1 Tax=Cellulosilyticum ruminicola TaxID=425254 RepID=UPI0006D14F76|nr:hypothetical protein [Cellulosilyticum ruminicola]
MTNEIIVRFNDSTPIDSYINNLQKEYNLDQIIVNDYLDIVDAYVLKCKNIENPITVINLLNKSNDVIYAEPNYIRD